MANQKQQDTEEKKPIAPMPKPALAMTGKGFEPANMEQAWRFATALSESSIVPDRYRGKPGDCLIALDLSMRLSVSWMAVMQHVYNVKGRPAMESVLSTALTNRSGLFVDPLEYEVIGENVDDSNYRVRAVAKRKSTGTVLYGAWITWKLVKDEGWLGKPGSKWKTMPEQMFHYRAASWFERRHCPEVSMGMLTPGEAESIPDRKSVGNMTFNEAEQQTQEQIESESGSEPVDATFEKEATTAEKAKAKSEAKKLRAAEAKAKKKAKEEAEKRSLCDFVCPVCNRFYRYGPKEGIGVPCECGKGIIQQAEPEPTDEQVDKTLDAAIADKTTDSLYTCKNCGLYFDKPKTSGTGAKTVRICPECLNKNIVATADEK